MNQVIVLLIIQSYTFPWVTSIRWCFECWETADELFIIILQACGHIWQTDLRKGKKWVKQANTRFMTSKLLFLGWIFSTVDFADQSICPLLILYLHFSFLFYGFIALLSHRSTLMMLCLTFPLTSTVNIFSRYQLVTSRRMTYPLYWNNVICSRGRAGGYVTHAEANRLKVSQFCKQLIVLRLNKTSAENIWSEIISTRCSQSCTAEWNPKTALVFWREREDVHKRITKMTDVSW